jgi:excisionase family DNA binding protein
MTDDYRKRVEEITNLDRKQLAQHLRVSVDTIRKWERMKLIPRIKIGHVIRFNLTRVEAALEKLERKAGV